MRKVLLTTAVLAIAVVCFVLATLPPAPVRHDAGRGDAVLARRTVRGAYHVHTTRSDGADRKAAVAAAAARAGLAFAIFTDHGDATRAPDPPVYIDGVLCIDAVEISTTGGHYVALDMPGAPYPLGGAASAVVEDVARLGGFGIVAHPDHADPELAWTDWNAPVDGIEWLNADAEWRDENVLALSTTLLHYLLRPGPAIASVFDRPIRTIDRWDDLSRSRQVTALAAVDAHGGAGGHRAERRAVIGPSYDASFAALSNRVVLDRPLSGEAAADARLVLGAIRKGNVYSVVDAFSPDVLIGMNAGEVSLQSPLPPGARTVAVDEGKRHRLEIEAAGARGNPAVPWVLTNWVGPHRPLPPAATVAGPAEPLTMGEWRVEKDPGSAGNLDVGAAGVTLRFQLRAGGRESQFVAAAVDPAATGVLGGQRPAALVFDGRAGAPMRISVQLRFPPDDERWVKSVYLDGQSRDVVVPLGELVSAAQSGAALPDAAQVRSLLFVVDTVNTRPGTAGSFTISGLRVRR